MLDIENVFKFYSILSVLDDEDEKFFALYDIYKAQGEEALITEITSIGIEDDIDIVKLCIRIYVNIIDELINESVRAGGEDCPARKSFEEFRTALLKALEQINA
jgi:hypothetical protein